MKDLTFQRVLLCALFACLCLSCEQNKKAGLDGTGSAGGTAQTKGGTKALAGGADVALDACPIAGLTLPAGTTIAKLEKDKLPKAWDVQFDSTASWTQIKEHVTAFVVAQGWTESPIIAPYGASLRYDAPDKKQYLMLMARFPDKDSPEMQDPKLQASEDYKKMKALQDAEPDFVLAVFEGEGSAPAAAKESASGEIGAGDNKGAASGAARGK